MARQTLIDLFDERVAASGEAVAIRYNENDVWKSLTWSEWQRLGNQVSAGLIELGVEHGERVAILSRTRREWVLTDLAAIGCGAVVVPIYDTQLSRQCRWILDNCGATVVFVEDPHQLEKLLAVIGELPNVRHIVYFDEYSTRDFTQGGRTALSLGELDLDALPKGCLISFDELRERGAGALAAKANLVRDRRRQCTADDIASIVYTSGTTGRPRGVVLTSDNFVSEARDCAVSVPLGPDDEQLLFLPLAHIFARSLYLSAIGTGSVTSFSRGVRHLLDEFRQIRPTFFAGVPSVFERIHAQVVSRSMLGRNAMGRNVAERMLELARKKARAEEGGGRLGIVDRAAYGVADSMLYTRVRELFGGRLRFSISGGAPLSVELAEFFFGAGVPVLEGYGLTETCAAITLNRWDDYRIGTVGRTLPSVEVRIAPDSEILVRGPSVMTRYWNNDEATEEAIVDGWLRTGDLGEFDGAFLRVTGRKKNLIVTANGKNIAPTPLEARLQSIPFVDRACIHGEGRRFLSALITLDEGVVRAWAEDAGLGSPTFSELCTNARIYEVVRKAVDELNRDVPTEETIRRFAILDQPFSADSGELTPSHKIRRGFVAHKYRSILDGFYLEAEP